MFLFFYLCFSDEKYSHRRHSPLIRLSKLSALDALSYRVADRALDHAACSGKAEFLRRFLYQVGLG